MNEQSSARELANDRPVQANGQGGGPVLTSRFLAVLNHCALTSLRLSLVTDVRVLLSHADHDALMPGASDDGREDGARSVIAGETGFAHAGSVVHHQSGNIFVTHVD